MKYQVGTKVKLNTFNETLNPDEDCRSHENYWKLIGFLGKIVKEKNIKSRVLVQFEKDINYFGLECHNGIDNSLWILETDLEEI